MTTKSRAEIEIEVEGLRAKLEKFKEKEIRLGELERQLESTLYNLGIHQEELRAQNEELIQSRENMEGLLTKYSVLFEDSPVGYFVIDSRQTVLEINRGAADLIGKAKEHILGNSLFPVVDPASRNVMNDHFLRVWNTGYATDELHLIPKNRQPIPCLFESRSITQPETGKLVSLTVAFDISARKEAEDRIAALAERNHRILDSVSDGVLGIGRDGCIEFANPTAARLLGRQDQDLLGRRPQDILCPLEEECHVIPENLSPFLLTLQDGETRTAEQESFQRLDGEWFPVEYVVAPTFKKGRVEGLVLTFRDITERKRAEEMSLAKQEAEAANRSKGAFLAAMSHEIRTPLNSILGMNELLRETRLNKEQASFVRVAGRAGETLLALLNDILDLSKIEAGQLSLEKIPFNLKNLVEETREILSVRIQEKALAFAVDFQKGLDPLRVGDPARLQQILLNLVGNAIKFTERGEVRLTVKKGDGDEIALSVADSGIGIPEDKLEMIFEPFSQVDPSITRRYGGTGLGLNICRRLISLMGGAIHVESQPQKGSVFSFTFHAPKSGKISSHMEKSPMVALPDRSRENQQLSILLVDDSEDNLLLAQSFLKKAKHQLEIAKNGREAVDVFTRGQFDLVLMDIQMPVMDGYTATREIRAWERSQGRYPTPILALTAFAMLEDEKRVFAAGCNAHLAKPVKKKRLLAAIGELTGPLRKRPKRK